MKKIKIIKAKNNLIQKYKNNLMKLMKIQL